MARWVLMRPTFAGSIYYAVGTTFADIAANILPAGWGIANGRPADLVLPSQIQSTDTNLLSALSATVATADSQMTALVNPGFNALSRGFQPC
jgi:hypothetical protein